MKQVEGKAQDIKGSVTGNIGDNIEGKAKVLAGKAQAAYGKAKDDIRSESKSAKR
jgi:uncharacterized protein YjbJ (UPF0337 family)